MARDCSAAAGAAGACDSPPSWLAGTSRLELAAVATSLYEELYPR